METKIIFPQNKAFGDELWIEPIIRHFLGQGHEVMLFCNHPDIYNHYPSDQLLLNCYERLFPLPVEPIILAFHHYPKMHFLEAYRIQAGIPDMPLSLPKLYLNSAEKQRVIKKKYALFHLDFYADPKNQGRNVYNIDWEKVIAFVRSQNLKAFQISNRANENNTLIAPLIPTATFRDVMSVIYNASLFIGLDSGPSHIASLFEVPSVIFFGSVNPAFRHLDKHRKQFVQSACPFAGCWHEKEGQGQPCHFIEREQLGRGGPGIPICSVHTTETVIEAIRALGGI